MQAILFGLGTVESPPLAASAMPFGSPDGLRLRLFRPLLPVGRERSLKYPSGGVLELDDMFSAFCFFLDFYSLSPIAMPIPDLRVLLS
jgi:hypothetical protein